MSYLGVEKVAILVFDDSGNKLLGNIYRARQLKFNLGELKKGQSLEAIQTIDPQGEYLFLYTGRNNTPKLSSHCTIRIRQQPQKWNAVLGKIIETNKNNPND